MRITYSLLGLNELAQGRALIGLGGGGAMPLATTSHAKGAILDFPRMHIVRDNYHNFLIAGVTGTDDIKGVPPELVQRLIDAVSLAGALSLVGGGGSHCRTRLRQKYRLFSSHI